MNILEHVGSPLFVASFTLKFWKKTLMQTLLVYSVWTKVAIYHIPSRYSVKIETQCIFGHNPAGSIADPLNASRTANFCSSHPHHDTWILVNFPTQWDSGWLNILSSQFWLYEVWMILNDLKCIIIISVISVPNSGIVKSSEDRFLFSDPQCW